MSLPNSNKIRNVSLLFLGLVISLQFCPSVQAIPNRTLDAQVGWQEIPNTKLKTVCPPNGFGGSGYGFSDNCTNVTAAWSSGAFDESRNRLLVWGGGHSDYFGNELYALNLDSNQVLRLTDPTLPLASGCPEAIGNGDQPNSRHTYDGLEYMAKADRLFAIGGSLATCGGMSNTTWTFDFKTNKWQNMRPTGPNPHNVPGLVTAYDPSTGMMWVRDDLALYSYDLTTNAYTRLFNDIGVDYHLVGALDSKRRQLVMIGGKQEWIIDLTVTPPTQKKLGSTGGDPIVNSNYPGLAYDPVEDKIVAWNGGETVFMLNLDTKTWSPVTYPGGPAKVAAGTFGRWAYVPKLKAFVVLNATSANAYLFRWSATTGILKSPQNRHGQFKSQFKSQIKSNRTSRWNFWVLGQSF